MYSKLFGYFLIAMALSVAFFPEFFKGRMTIYTVACSLILISLGQMFIFCGEIKNEVEKLIKKMDEKLADEKDDSRRAP